MAALTAERLRIECSEALVPLLQPYRHKGAYGGRGGAKSHFFAEMLVVRCHSRITRAVCIREIQRTLKESVRQLVIDKINKLGLNLFFEVLESEIRHRFNGSIIIFMGMQSFNADNIKSLEGFDIAWVEEAQTLSARSLRLLKPTIRKEGSEIWYSWNPRHESDSVDRFFRGAPLSEDMVCVEVNWRDNPWFPDVLRRERERDYKIDPDMAEHIWEGGYEIISEASYFSKLVTAAEREGRIGYFPYDPRFRLRTAWDIGVDDYSAIWFIQDDGFAPWVVDYYEASGDGAQQLVESALPELLPDAAAALAALKELEREVPFKYDRHFFPHDVMVREWGAGAKERWRTLKGLGVWPIHKGANQGPEERINATRKLLPIMRFNNTRRVQVGLSRLRRYSRKFNETMQVYEGPLHDINSHGADAFGEYAVNCGIVPTLPVQDPVDKSEVRFEGRVLETGETVIQSNMSVMEIVQARLKAKKRSRS